MKEIGRVPLPPHPPDGEFDHAAVDPIGDRLYVAHPSNDSVEIVDLTARRLYGSISGLRGVAGVWVDAESRLLFTSNRGEDTASIFRLTGTGVEELYRAPTGHRPNGMAYDPGRSILMVAGVGNAKSPGLPPTLTFIDTSTGKRVGQLEVPGRTRWALHHAPTDSFYANIADPPCIVAVRARESPEIYRTLPMPAAGPHGLEQDPDGQLLYCACDEGVLLEVDLTDGSTRVAGTLAGPPDVLWLNPQKGTLYCAIGEPGTVEAFRLHPVRASGTYPTAEGAHTLALDPRRGELHVLLPGSHEDLVLSDP